MTIISMFPGTGRNLIHEVARKAGFKICFVSQEWKGIQLSVPAGKGRELVCIDSSIFYKGEFPNNYIKFIVKAIEQFPDMVVVVSTHEEVREKLVELGYTYKLVYPEFHLKEVYLAAYEKSNKSKDFIDKMDANWEEYFLSCKCDPMCNSEHYRLDEGETIADVFNYLV